MVNSPPTHTRDWQNEKVVFSESVLEPKDQKPSKKKVKHSLHGAFRDDSPSSSSSSHDKPLVSVSTDKHGNVRSFTPPRHSESPLRHHNDAVPKQENSYDSYDTVHFLL